MAGKKQISETEVMERFELPKGEVFIKFIREAKGTITDPKHISYGGLMEGNGITLPAKQLHNGNYANVLNDSEKEALEDIMGMEKNSLSVYKKEDNYWDSISIRLTKEGLYLKQEDPDEFIKLKVLESYTDLIAPSLKAYNTAKKKTYKFIIVRPEEENQNINREIDTTQEAWMQFGKISDSPEAMIDFLLMNSEKLPVGSKREWIRSRVGKVVTENPKKFLSIINDPDYKIKIILKKGVTSKAIKTSGGLYQTDDGVNIAFKNEQPTLMNAIAFLKSIEGQEMRMRLEAEIEKK